MRVPGESCPKCGQSLPRQRRKITKKERDYLCRFINAELDDWESGEMTSGDLIENISVEMEDYLMGAEEG